VEKLQRIWDYRLQILMVICGSGIALCSGMMLYAIFHKNEAEVRFEKLQSEAKVRDSITKARLKEYEQQYIRVLSLRDSLLNAPVNSNR